MFTNEMRGKEEEGKKRKEGDKMERLDEGKKRR